MRSRVNFNTKKVVLDGTKDYINEIRRCCRLILIACVGSSISRESHCGVHLNAGPEIGVASTKAYTSQFLALVLCEDSILKEPRRKAIIDGLQQLPELVKKVLQCDKRIREYAEDLYISFFC